MTQKSHVEPPVHSPEGPPDCRSVPPCLPTLPTKFIAMTLCVDWTVFLTLTSPFNPQPL